MLKGTEVQDQRKTTLERVLLYKSKVKPASGSELEL